LPGPVSKIADPTNLRGRPGFKKGCVEADMNSITAEEKPWSKFVQKWEETSS
jgi:hypothetical protein